MPLKKPENPRKEIIFKAALHCFNKNGYYKTSIDDIAKKARITKGGIYYYFKSKKSLFIELFHYTIDKYFERIKIDTQNIKDPLTCLRTLLEKAGEDVRKNIEAYKFAIEFFNTGIREDEIRKEVTSFFKDRMEIFSNIIQKGIDAGEFKKINPYSIAWNLNFLSIGLLFTNFTSDLFFDPLDQHNINVEIFFNGIRQI